ncbi:MAG: methyltransferase domain-containing protein [ANME-2 cluster archaeon]|nr:methyltransferase domain-containing protein [ANME-2 cluster archaeon]
MEQTDISPQTGKTGNISRVTRSKAESKAAYDRMSTWYDLLTGGSEKKFREAGLEKLDTREGEVILELGFGTGHCISAIAKAVGDTGKVYGIDLSEGMLEITSGRLAKAGLLERAELTCGDATALPYPDNFFDAVFMSFTLELFDTPVIPVVLQQCKRVLKPGGRICVVAMAGSSNPGTMMRVYEWAHRNFEKYVDCRPIFVGQVLEDASFTNLDTTMLSLWGLPVKIVLAKKETGIVQRS